MGSKDLLFLSSTSLKCKEYASFITTNGLRDKFLLVYVDIGKFNIPACIRQIPTLLTTDKKLIVDEQLIFQYIRSLVGNQPVVSTFNWEGGNFSSQYSVINEEDSHGNMTPQQYTMINDPVISGSGQAGFQEDCTKHSKFDASAYETYVAARNKDEEDIKHKYNPINRF